MRRMLGPAERLTLIFLALLITLTIISAPTDRSWTDLLATYLILAGVTTLGAAYRDRNLPGGLPISGIVTVVTILFVFNSLGELIAALRCHRYDDVLIRIDYAMFGVNPTVWLERLINPVMTTLLQFAYISYYFIPISLGILLIVKNKQCEFEEALFGIVLCFYLSYIGYLLFPAVGPRFTLSHLQTTDLHASPFIKMIQTTLNGMEKNKTDAFPSGHTAVALTSLYYAWKYKEKRLFGVLVPLVSALIFSTVYLRYHYVIDVFAGIALFIGTIAIAPKFFHMLLQKPAPSGDQRHHAP